MLAIRYLQAFRNRGEYTLLESLRHELSSDLPLVAATRHGDTVTTYDDGRYVWRDDDTQRNLGIIGLRVKQSAIRRTFLGDVWSMSRKDGSLYPTREPSNYSHWESFCRPVYTGLVISITAFAKRNKSRLSESGGILDCIQYAREIDLPVFVYKNGKLSPYNG